MWLAVLLVAGSSRPPRARAQASGTSEYAAKAAFLFHFAQFVEWPSEAFKEADSPLTYCTVGEDAFRTATGVHAAAVIKAYKKKDIELANAVYSGVPSQMFGLEQIIDIGPMSGKSNVLFWLERHGVPATDEVVDRIYKRAKASNHTLTETEIRDCL